MKRNGWLGLALASFVLGAGALSGTAFADTLRAELTAPSSVAVVAEYVDKVDGRLQGGRYDNIAAGERSWIIDSIAGLRKALANAGPDAAVSPELARLSSEFELGMLKIEEGGIVCRRESRTGTRLSTQRCYSKKRLQEQSQDSQTVMRNLRRSQNQPTTQ